MQNDAPRKTWCLRCAVEKTCLFSTLKTALVPTREAPEILRLNGTMSEL